VKATCATAALSYSTVLFIHAFRIYRSAYYFFLKEIYGAPMKSCMHDVHADAN
jgi:hypothetical protein